MGWGVASTVLVLAVPVLLIAATLNGLFYDADFFAAGAGATLALIAFFGALTMVNFEQLFLTFHVLSFDNDLWQLDPRRDNLIRFFPFEFWFDATVTVALRAVLSALVVGGLALIGRRWLHTGGIGERAVP